MLLQTVAITVGLLIQRYSYRDPTSTTVEAWPGNDRASMAPPRQIDPGRDIHWSTSDNKRPAKENVAQVALQYICNNYNIAINDYDHRVNTARQSIFMAQEWTRTKELQFTLAYNVATETSSWLRRGPVPRSCSSLWRSNNFTLRSQHREYSTQSRQGP